MVWKCGWIAAAAAGVFPGEFLVYPAKWRVTLLLPRVVLAASSVSSRPRCCNAVCSAALGSCCAGAAAWDAGDQPGSGFLHGVDWHLIAFCACFLWHKTSSILSLFQPVLQLNLLVEGMLEREPAVTPLDCSSHDLGCSFLGLGACLRGFSCRAGPA